MDFSRIPKNFVPLSNGEKEISSNYFSIEISSLSFDMNYLEIILHYEILRMKPQHAVRPFSSMWRNYPTGSGKYANRRGSEFAPSRPSILFFSKTNAANL